MKVGRNVRLERLCPGWTECKSCGECTASSKLMSGPSYGTWDHLILLLGRLARYVADDHDRKIQESKAQGPQPGMAQAMPFSGMLPPKGAFPPPRGFSYPPPADSRSSAYGVRAHENYAEAVRNWESIRHAFDTFEHKLSPAFRPLEPEYTDLKDDEFGPALQYRTYSIAGIWLNYYMGLIHLYRNHPDMPPTAMQSVGLSARTTVVYATQIGRISAGLCGDTSSTTEISSTLAAALIECSLPLFVAGVQVCCAT